MLSEAAGLAVLAALSPAALLVVAVFLGSATPRRTGIIYLAGAITMTAAMATVVFIALRVGHLYTPHQHKTRYGLRLGLGVLLLAAGLYLLRRGPRARDPAKEKQGLVARMTVTPGPKAAFIVGILVYSPSLTFVAAVQIVATSKASVAYSVLALILVIAITVLCVWLPLLLYLLMPERTGRLLTSFSGWLRRHGQVLLVGGLMVGGVLLTLDGILGLTGAL
jgi:Sap, sulfolipid-1-addressing protein